MAAVRRKTSCANPPNQGFLQKLFPNKAAVVR